MTQDRSEKPALPAEDRIVRPPSTALVIFGATGDLTHRKLIPALYNLFHDEYLPENFIVIGAARSQLSDDEFRKKLHVAVKEFSRRTLSDEVWERFAKTIFYQSVDGTKTEDFARLRARLEELGRERGEQLNYLYYLATAPTHFGPICTNLRANGLIEPPGTTPRRTAVVIEKPFGHDLPSARELNGTLRHSLAEEQIFRIDHYLGKETVQNILVFRFANGIFEPLWNRNYIDHIQVSVCEDLGLGGRAPYFDKTGIMRDIVQNHLLQILSLLCIEAPMSLNDANGIRDEKVKVLKSMKRLKPGELTTHTVRAQYARGSIKGKEVPGYLEESGVDPNSMTDTFVALKLEIDNWRWAGVPIYVRAGKRLPKRITEITVFFRRPPGSLFKGRQIVDMEQNVLAIQVQPKEGISLTVNAKPPGLRMRVKPVAMDFTYDMSFGVPSPEAYERLLLDAMKGDATLFTRADEIEESWDLLAPILAGWASPNPPPMYTYEAGSWGPAAAADLLRPLGHSWRRL